MAVQMGWSQLWAEFKTMPVEMMNQVAVSLDAGEDDGFEKWLKSRSPKAQVDVLDNAPDPLRQHMYEHGILSPFAVFAMDIESKTKVKDSRFPRRRK